MENKDIANIGIENEERLNSQMQNIIENGTENVGGRESYAQLLGGSINVENLKFKYGSKEILKDISFSVNAGRIVGLLGPNGSGKTTIIKVITDLLNGYEGKVTVFGKEIGPDSKRVISYLPDIEYLNKDEKLERLIKDQKLLFSDFDVEKANELCKSMGLDVKSKVKKLSKGMREKFYLILTLSRKALIYILDEPIAGVDPAARDFILDTIIKNYNQEATILICTHLISDIEGILDDYVFLNDGKVVEQGTTESVRELYNTSLDARFREIFKCL